MGEGGTRASVTSHTVASAGCHQAHRRWTAVHAGFHINWAVSLGSADVQLWTLLRYGFRCGHITGT